ncbi:hypothetical protein FSP39_000348 [Pinctada imbricata]|uniref:CENP-T/Histone H4 histone fold domain-containing protein n=1 Tax=Pinctada imbricata TaxID=66713 RepID=A0AA88XXU8_PINIB|nr:hypothetical protein FSP39_000348 [Pinctada imbricata]
MEKSQDDSATPRTLIEGYFDRAPTQRSQIPNRKRKAIDRTPVKDGSKRLSQTLPSRSRRSSPRAAKKRRSSISVATEVTPKSLLEDYLVSARSTMPSLRRLPRRTPQGREQQRNVGSNNVLEDTRTPRTQLDGLMYNAPEEASVHVVKRNQRRRTVSVNSPAVNADHTVNIQMSSIRSDSMDSTEPDIDSSNRRGRLMSMRNIHVDVSMTDSAASSPRATRKSTRNASLKLTSDNSINSPGKVLQKSSLANESPEHVTEKSQVFSPGRVLRSKSPAVTYPNNNIGSPSSMSSFDFNKSVDIAMSPNRDSDLSVMTSPERAPPSARNRKAEGLSRQLLREKFIQGLKDATQVLPDKESTSEQNKSPDRSMSKTLTDMSNSAMPSHNGTPVEISMRQSPRRNTSSLRTPSSPSHAVQETSVDLTPRKNATSAQMPSSPRRTPLKTPINLTPGRNTSVQMPSSPRHTPLKTPVNLTPGRNTSVQMPSSPRHTPLKTPVNLTPGRNTSVQMPSSPRHTPLKTPVNLTPRRNNTSIRSLRSQGVTPQKTTDLTPRRVTTSVAKSSKGTPQRFPTDLSLVRNSTLTQDGPGTENHTPRKSSVFTSGSKNSSSLSMRQSPGKNTSQKSPGDTSSKQVPNMEEGTDSPSRIGQINGNHNRLSNATPAELGRNVMSSKSLTRVSSIGKSRMSAMSSSSRSGQSPGSRLAQSPGSRNVQSPSSRRKNLSAIPSTGEATPDVTELDTTELFPLRTPRFGPRESDVPSPLYTSTPAPPRQNAVKNRTTQPPRPLQTNIGLKRRPVAPIPKSQFLLNSTIVNMFKHCCKTRVNKDALPDLVRVTDRYFEQACDDLKGLAKHGRRNYIDKSDCEMLMKRQGFITDKVSLNGLIEKNLPMELRQELIPIARSGNKVVP